MLLVELRVFLVAALAVFVFRFEITFLLEAAVLLEVTVRVLLGDVLLVTTVFLALLPTRREP